jgi:excisionase family DNA binding protein
MEYWTVKEYAELKRVSVATVHRWIRVGWVKAERTAGEHGQWRILKEQESSVA